MPKGEGRNYMESATKVLKGGKLEQGSITPSIRENLTLGGYIPLFPEVEKSNKNVSQKEHTKKCSSVVPPTKAKEKEKPICPDTMGHAWGEMWQQGNLQLVLCDPRGAPYPKATKEAGGGSTREGAQHKMQIMTPRSAKNEKNKKNEGQRKEAEGVGQHKATIVTTTTKQKMQSRWRWCAKTKKRPREKGQRDPKTPQTHKHKDPRGRDHIAARKRRTKEPNQKGEDTTKRTTEGPQGKKWPHMAQAKAPKKATTPKTNPKSLQVKSSARGKIDRGTLPQAEGFAKGYVRIRTFLHYVEH